MEIRFFSAGFVFFAPGQGFLASRYQVCVCVRVCIERMVFATGDERSCHYLYEFSGVFYARVYDKRENYMANCLFCVIMET